MANNQAQKRPDDKNRGYYDIRNARALRAADNDNDPRVANFVPERRPEQKTANNDNEQERQHKETTSRLLKQKITPANRFKNYHLEKSVKLPTRIVKPRLMRASRAVTPIITVISIVYPVQIFFGIICLIGFATMAGLDTSGLLSAADWVSFDSVSSLGGALYVIGGVGAMLCGGVIAGLTAAPLKLSGGHPAGGISLMILAVCLALHLCPVFNLFPISALWCLYVFLAK